MKQHHIVWAFGAIVLLGSVLRINVSFDNDPGVTGIVWQTQNLNVGPTEDESVDLQLYILDDQQENIRLPDYDKERNYVQQYQEYLRKVASTAGDEYRFLGVFSKPTIKKKLSLYLYEALEEYDIHSIQFESQYTSDGANISSYSLSIAKQDQRSLQQDISDKFSDKKLTLEASSDTQPTDRTTHASANLDPKRQIADTIVYSLQQESNFGDGEQRVQTAKPVYEFDKELSFEQKSYFRYQPTYEGAQILEPATNVKIENNQEVTRVFSPQIDTSKMVDLDLDPFIPENIMKVKLNVLWGDNYTLEPGVKIVPFYHEGEKEYISAYQVYTPRDMVFYDIDSGVEVLRRSLVTHEQVQANVYYDNKSAQEMIPLPEIKYDNTHHADTQGNVSPQGNNISIKSQSTIGIDPLRIYLYGQTVTKTFPVTNIIDATELGDDVVTVYRHIKNIQNKVRNFFPGFDDLNGKTVDVTINSVQDCNASAIWPYLDIDVYQGNSYCDDSAYYDDILYHEFGHLINGEIYNGMSNSSLNEGIADVWAYAMTEDLILGENRVSNYVRSYVNPKTWNQMNGTAHNDGQIIAGAFIKLGQSIGIPAMMELLYDTLLGTPDAFCGNGYPSCDINATRALYIQILDDTVVAGGGENGQYYSEIITAFNSQGIYSPNYGDNGPGGPSNGCINDSDCNDNLFCNGSETCVGGSCTAGNNPCPNGTTCNEALDICQNVGGGMCVQDSDCDDGLFCNGGEICLQGSCSSPGDPCPTGTTCNETSDMCDAPPSNCSTNADCDDGLYCNGSETCSNGQCLSGIAPCPAGQICNEQQNSCTPIQSNQQCTYICISSLKNPYGGGIITTCNTPGMSTPECGWDACVGRCANNFNKCISNADCPQSQCMPFDLQSGRNPASQLTCSSTTTPGGGGGTNTPTTSGIISPGFYDYDGDGVPDSMDYCDMTPPNAPVNDQGCADVDGDDYTEDIDPDDNNPCVPDPQSSTC